MYTYCPLCRRFKIDGVWVEVDRLTFTILQKEEVLVPVICGGHIKESDK